jgi:hypothetical protein
MVIKATGIVRGGVIVPEGTLALPEGTRVDISAEVATAAPSSLAEAVALFGGKITGLPPDLSRNHDHYLYGTPKK